MIYPNKNIYHFATGVFSALIAGAFALGLFIGNGVATHDLIDANPALVPPPPITFCLSGKE